MELQKSKFQKEIKKDKDKLQKELRIVKNELEEKKKEYFRELEGNYSAPIGMSSYITVVRQQV